MNSELGIARSLVKPAPTATGEDTCYLCARVIGDNDKFVGAAVATPDGSVKGYYFCDPCYESGKVARFFTVLYVGKAGGR